MYQELTVGMVKGDNGLKGLYLDFALSTDKLEVSVTTKLTGCYGAQRSKNSVQ